MTSLTRRLSVVAATLAAFTAAACSETSPTEQARLDAAAASALGAAFSTTPIGYGDLASSFVGGSVASFDGSSLWVGGGREASFGRGSLMGGGLGEEFLGSIGFGRGFGHHGPFGGGLGCAGTFNAATGRVECATETRNGLTITRSAGYATATGTVQQAFDTITTNSVNLRSAVTGTVTFTADNTPDGDHRGHGWGHGRGNIGRLLGDTATILTATTTVNSTSSRTVAGLAQGSTRRTVSGASRGTESTTGTSSRGAFTATRTVGDTTTGLIVPVRVASDTARTYPTAGTVIRAIQATLTYTGATPTTLTRREVITYNGTATATVVITENGVTRNCTRTLPRGSLTCQ
jgi:hypothetical protein